MKAQVKNKGRARSLRKNSTETEQKLWRYLRDRQLLDCKFRRQQPIDHYIVDFVCQEKSLIVELDGGQHIDQQEYDHQRTLHLETSGYKVLRFWNHDVLTEIDIVLGVIESHLR